MNAERNDQILDAFEACVARDGLEGTTLQMVAEEAGLARSLIRHYLGNRDELLAAWVNRAVERYRRQLDELVAALPRRKRADALVGYLFHGAPTEADQVMDLVVANAGRYESCRGPIADFIEHLVEVLTRELQIAFPGASRARCFEVAGGVAAISMSAETLSRVAVRRRTSRTWKKAAQRLVATLAD